MKKMILNFLLMITAFLVFIPLFTIGVIYTFVKHMVRFDYSFSKQMSVIFRSVALGLDGLANAGAGELLTDVYKPKYLRYSKWYQTISAVTGINYLKGDDKGFRRFLDRVLGKKHCEEAITEADRKYYDL